jgi:hypothetical protein
MTSPTNDIADNDLVGVNTVAIIAQKRICSRENIGYRYQTHNIAIVCNWQMVNGIALHQSARLCQSCRWRHRDQVGTHDCIDTEHGLLL